MKGQYYWILALVFALLIAIFAVINVDSVEVNYLFGTGEAPLILVILISVLMGGIVTAAVGAVRYYRLQREVRKLRVNQHKSTASSSTNAGDKNNNSKKQAHGSADDDSKHKSK